MAGHSLFFYGTLRDPDVLSAVLGRPAAALALGPARLVDHAVHRVAGAGYPMILPAPGGVADGLLAEALDAEALARIAFYEGAHDYALCGVEVLTRGGPRAAQVFFPRPGRLRPAEPWDLAAWRAADGGISAEAALELMEDFARAGPGAAAAAAAAALARYPMMRARAQARLAARKNGRRARRIGGPQTAEDVEILEHRRPYRGFFNLDEYEVTLPGFAGGRLHPGTRTAFVAADAVTVLPYDPVRDRVLLVEQFRIGPFARGDRHPWTLEAIAGRRDPGESCEETARREAREEAGLELAGLERIAGYYPSPGALSEYIVSFLGLADLPDGMAGGVHGMDGEGEDIRTHLVGFDALMAALESGEAATGPLVIAAHWLARNRARLRRAAGA